MMQFQSRRRATLSALAAVLLALWLASQALAQADDRLSGLSISVWPEYDQPSVLVQYEGELANKDQLPRTVAVFIPATATVNAVAYFANNGDLLNTDPPTTEDAADGFKRVSFKLPAPKFHLEFYYNPLTGSPNKSMDFVFKSAQTADNVQLEIQQPLKSENFVTDPATQFTSTDAHKFVYHIFNYATLSTGQTVKIHVSYTRSDPNPSIAGLPTPASNASTNTSAAPATDNTTTTLIAALVALAFALFALGGFYWWSRNRQVPAAVRVSGDGGRRRRGKSTPAAIGFCTQCGHGLAADDNFCPRCGTPRRTA